MRIGAYLIAGLNAGVQGSKMDFGDLGGEITDEFLNAVNEVDYDGLDAALMQYLWKNLDISDLKVDTNGMLENNEDNASLIESKLAELFSSGEYLKAFGEYFGEDWSAFKSSAV